MHRMVQIAMHNWLREHGQWQRWVEKVLARLIEVVPFGGYDNNVVWTAYLPQAVHVADLAEVYKTEDRISLLDRIGLCEQTLGRHKAAEVAHRKALERREEVLGKEQRDALASMNNLAQALSDQGKYTEAEEMHQEILALKEKSLGKEHPNTLASTNNLAQILSDQGKYVEAEKMQRETLALKEKVLGREHTDTLTSVYYLAHTLHQCGQHEEALSLYHRACIGYEKALGWSHPTTQACLNHYSPLGQLCGLESSDGDERFLSSTGGDLIHPPSQQHSQPVESNNRKTSKLHRLFRKLGLE